MIFFASSRKVTFVFLENMIFFFIAENERYTIYGVKKQQRIFLYSQKMHGNMTFSAYSIKMVLAFPTNYEIILLSNRENMISSRNIHLKMTFPVSLKKMILVLESMIQTFQVDILEWVPTIFCTFMETFLGAFLYCFPMRKPGDITCRIEG